MSDVFVLPMKVHIAAYHKQKTVQSSEFKITHLHSASFSDFTGHIVLNTALRLRVHLMKLKICVAGPKSVGKTAISNFLAGQSKLASNTTFTPTIGVRILEFDVKLAQDTVSIELWDASGDHA